MTGGRFEPGQSGNPVGRPKVLGPVHELARVHTDEAINVAVAIMRDATSPEATRLKAVELVLESPITDAQPQPSRWPTAQSLAGSRQVSVLEAVSGKEPLRANAST